jgi:hypothetical protein
LPEHWLDSHELNDAHRVELAGAEIDNSGG